MAALTALSAEGWRRPVWHVASVVLYLLSILTYELGAPLILLAGLLYLWRGNRREALTRWAVDVGVLGLTLALVTAGHQESLGFGGMIDHAKLILDQGLTVLTGGAVPFGVPPETFVLGLLVAVAVVGGLVWRLLPEEESSRTELGRWLVIAGAALVATAAGWLLLVPANPYYSPLTAGVGNRVNAVAALGIVLLVYALVMTAATLAFRGVRYGPSLAAGLGAVGALLIGWGYGDRTRSDIDVWDAAFAQEQQIIDFLGTKLPDPPRESVVYLFGHPAFYAPGVPVFAAPWDLNGMLKLYYRDGSLQGFPATRGVRCSPAGVEAIGHANSLAPYNRVVFADFVAREVANVRTRRQCEDATATFKPGPFQLTAG